MKELIGTFYDLSVLDTDQLKPQPEQINFTNLLLDFIAENAPILEKAQIEPDIALPDTAIFIKTDQGMLTRILQNLLTNAIRYTTGTIRINLEQTSDDHVLFQISNPFTNSDELDTARLFERFYTGDKSRHCESSGLGLAVVKLLAEKLNGSVSAELHSNILYITLCL